MFDHYISFGDSISIDDYAGPNLGAASLFYSNDDELWPEFERRDLASLNPDCSFRKLAYDGSTLVGAWMQLERAPRELEGKVLATLTIGGNDLLCGVGQPDNLFRAAFFSDVVDYLGEGRGEVTFAEWRTSLRRWLERVRSCYKDCCVVMGNIYDPGDGTGLLPGGDNSLAYLRPYLEEMNALLEDVARQEGLLFADINRHFLGHAQGDPPWIHCQIEPTRLGSSEVRRLFWEAIQKT